MVATQSLSLQAIGCELVSTEMGDGVDQSFAAGLFAGEAGFGGGGEAAWYWMAEDRLCVQVDSLRKTKDLGIIF